MKSAQISTWKHARAGLSAFVGSLLATLQSPRMNPSHAFNIIQTRVDAFVR